MTTTATAPVHVGTFTVGTPAWHHARRATLNGSEIAAVLGISPYESAFSLWHRKRGSLGEVAQNDEMYWGSRLEDVIRDEYAQRHPELVVSDGGGLWRHPARAWQGGSPDGRLSKPGARQPHALLEVKTARYDDHWGDEGTDEIPVWYRSQALWYLDVFGLPVCHIAVLITGSDYREYQVAHDETDLAVMREQAEAFLDSVASGVQPAIDGHDATYQALRELHPDIEPTSINLPDDVALPYRAALGAFKDAQQEKQRAAALVLAAMGNARDAYHGGELIARRQAKTLDPDSIPYLIAARGVADQHRSAA